MIDICQLCIDLNSVQYNYRYVFFIIVCMFLSIILCLNNCLIASYDVCQIHPL